MIPTKTTITGLEALSQVIAELAGKAEAACQELPANGFQTRLRFDAVAKIAEDMQRLATAAAVLIRRAEQDREPV